MTCAKFGGSGEVVEIEQKQKCEFPNMTFLDGYCEGYIDQMNCTREDVFVCTVRVGEGEEFLNTRLRRQWVCNNKVLCADGSDEWCHAISDACQVSKRSGCNQPFFLETCLEDSNSEESLELKGVSISMKIKRQPSLSDSQTKHLPPLTSHTPV